MPSGIYNRKPLTKEHRDILIKNISNRVFKTHQKTGTRIYQTWKNMKSRCYYVKNIRYKYYGGRGITVCDRWLEWKNGFINFYNDMGDIPEGKSLDRINNDGNYEPSNCKWSTYSEQNYNKRKQTKEQ